MTTLEKIITGLFIAFSVTGIITGIYSAQTLKGIASGTTEAGVLGVADSREKISADFFGTTSTLVSINNVYASTTRRFGSRQFENTHYDVQFAPGVTAQQIQMMHEVSNDSCQTFFPFTTKENTTSSINIYVTSATSGVPIVFPTGFSTTASVTTSGAMDFDSIGDCIRTSIRTTTGTASVYVRGTVTTK